MNAPVDGLGTNDTYIELSWTAITSPTNGDSPVISYVLYWD